MPEDPFVCATPSRSVYGTPVKSTPILKPPYPFNSATPSYDDSNYMTSNPGSRTRSNILKLINSQDSELTPFEGNRVQGHTGVTESETSRFNSLSRSTHLSSEENGGGSSSLPRSVISDHVGLPLGNYYGLPRVEHGRPPVEIHRRPEPVGQSSSLDQEQTLTSTVQRHWEYVSVNLTRVPGYGFGIAVSGGCDNPHFANGDPAIAISDVLKGGPAQGKLQINDRIVSANGISLDNVDYSTAVQILRDSGPSVNLRVKRRVNPQSYKVTVPLNSKRLKKLSFDSLGFTVSVTIQIKTVDSPSLGLREGDLIDKIQGLRVNELFNEKVVCKELRRVLEDQTNGNSANLNLTVKRSGSNRNNVPQQVPQQSNTLHQPSHSVGNLYVQPPTRANNKSFDSTNTPLPPPPSNCLAPPPPPPRPPLPTEYELNQPTHPLRSINFIKQNQLGIRLSGGNRTGIIVSAVQKNSQADLQGLTTHDKIIRVNEHDFLLNPPTREQAIEILSSIPNDTLVNLTVEKVAPLQMTDNQDEFYVRTRVSTDEFKLHEVLVITDTLVNGLVGQWEAYRLDHQGNRVDKLIVPNMKNGRELLKKSWKRTTSFRNREYEELLSTLPATEPYDVVEKKSADLHTRPVVLFTPINGTIIDCLMQMKHASRLFKVVRSVDELDFNDGRVRVVQDVVSIRCIQELHERSLFPFVVFGNFPSKDALKEACKDSTKYSKAKKLYGVLQKVRDKLGSYVDMVIELRDSDDGAVRIYEAVVQGVRARVFFAAKPTPNLQNGSTSTSTTPKQRSSSKSRIQKDSSSLHRPTSSSQHTRHKSTDSLTSPNLNTQTPTSPSPASMSSLKFPNFNIPPPCSILEDNSSPYDKRVNLHRSATSVGPAHGPDSEHRSDTRSTHHPTTPTPMLNPISSNFAHSPVFERSDRSRSIPAQPASLPPVDRTKKPSSSSAFYPATPSKSATPNKPVPPPKPRLPPMNKNERASRSLFRPVQSNNTESVPDDDAGQTYLNIPMNSKAAMQQQQFSNVTQGVFDWRGGRLVQAHTFGNQIPIEVFIPEGAIPPGETVTVWFQIVDYNVREDPHNPLTQKKMLSPLVKFGPENYRFVRPVEIRIPQYCANGLSGNDNGMLAKVLMNNHSDYWTKIDIQNGNFPNSNGNDQFNSDVKVVSLTVQQF